MAVQRVAGPVFLRDGGDVVEIEAALGLGIGEGENGLTADKAVDVFFPLCSRTAETEEIAADYHGLQIGFDH